MTISPLLFSSASESVKPLFTSSTPALFASRSLLPFTSGYLWRIESGFVRSLAQLEDGTTVILGIWGAGEVVNKPFAQAHNCHVECMTKVEAAPVLIDSLPHYSNVLLEQVNQLENLMQIRSYKRVDMMLIRFLGWLSDRFGKDTPQGRLIDLRLTHLDIAESIGTTRVTVTRTLNQLEQQGVIKYLPLKRIVLCEEDLWHYEI